MKSSSSPAFSSGVFFKGAEDNGGNSIGGNLNRKPSPLEVGTKTCQLNLVFVPELFPLVHMCSNVALIKEREGKPKRLDKVILTAGDKCIVKLLRKVSNLLGII